jgi:hypothetical protein
MCVCVFVCVRACVCVSMCVCLYACVCVYMRVHLDVHFDYLDCVLCFRGGVCVCE